MVYLLLNARRKTSRYELFCFAKRLIEKQSLGLHFFPKYCRSSSKYNALNLQTFTVESELHYVINNRLI